jgi:glycosyltransferase involved in cell wall biosynthesis
MKLLKEISDLYRFIWSTSPDDRKVVFYAEHEGYYPNFEGLIEELAGSGHSIAYVTSDLTDPVLKTSSKKVKAFYVKKLLFLFMLFVKCRVFVLTLTDLNQFHLKRSINPVEYVYVFHSLVSTHMMYRLGAFNHYDTILCAGPHQIEEIRKFEELNDLPAKQLIEAGYYRLERIYDSYKEYSAQKETVESELAILIAPSWGVHNIFESCGEEIITVLLAAGFNVIARPHPEALRRSPELFDRLESKYEDQSNFTLERSVATDDSLLRSDILICDCSGVALEYAFGTERPVLFLDVPPKVQNPDYQDLGIEPIELSLRSQIGVIVSPDDLSALADKIQELINRKEEFQHTIAALREKLVFEFGRSSEVGAGYIAEALESDL